MSVARITCRLPWHADAVTPELSIVVVHYRIPAVLAECLARLSRFAPHAELIVVDTDPDDAMLDHLRSSYPGLKVVPAPNHSFAHAVNLGLRRTHAPLLAYMNADVYVEAETFPLLQAALAAHSEAGIAGPLALNPNGRPQDQGPDYRLYYLRLPRTPGAAIRVPWLAGCLQMLRRDVLERCGGLDPSLRFYNEDIEFCVRAHRAGFTILLVRAPVLHVGGSSTPSLDAFMLEGRRGGMQVSRRYYPPIVRRLHRAGLWFEARFGTLFGRDLKARGRYHEMLTMVRNKGFDESPFGATLTERRTTGDYRA